MAGRRVLVTGAASGIGRATVPRGLGDGAHVVGLDRDESGLSELAELAGDSFAPIRCDVADPHEVETAFSPVAEVHEALDGVVNAAGVGGEPGEVGRTDVAFRERTLGVNLTGVFLISREALPLLRRAGGGSIVHVASQLGMVGTTNSLAYCASKGGVIALGKAMALDHSAERIRVNIVCPGPVETPMFAASNGPEELERLTRDMIPLGWIGQPGEIAAVIVFLLSADASYLTSSVLALDGGWTAQ